MDLSASLASPFRTGSGRKVLDRAVVHTKHFPLSLLVPLSLFPPADAERREPETHKARLDGAQRNLGAVPVHGKGLELDALKVPPTQTTLQFHDFLTHVMLRVFPGFISIP